MLFVIKHPSFTNVNIQLLSIYSILKVLRDVNRVKIISLRKIIDISKLRGTKLSTQKC